ncbi:venom peptide isomerase heavy chain-like [Oppia nitens]|uniref:venom peptide isomerase heavy chain-like n=1 Tax=Oppia nitens TaxID=1686743 RepID=UPI0023DA3EEA|nr:venom peptide isomerase heavy chain-like [Oppia nitens]
MFASSSSHTAQSATIVNDRIVGGNAVNIAEYPYTVAIIKGSDCHNFTFISNGAIVGNKWILTSSFDDKTIAKLVNNLDDYYVRAGASNLFSDCLVSKHTVTIQIDKVILHDNFNKYPIALLRLSQSFTYGLTIRKIRLSKHYVADGTDARLTGWGGVSSTGQQYSPQLQVVQLKTIGWQQCKKLANFSVEPDVDLCTVSDHKGGCNGDYGAPLVSNDHQLLIGVNTYYKCGTNKYDDYSTITPIQYVNCIFLNMFDCNSQPDSSLDIVEILMPELLNTTMTCNGMVTDNYQNIPFDVVLGNGDTYYREVGLITDGPCAGSKIQGWSIYLPPEGQCITKPMTSSKPLFEHWKITGNCKATCNGKSYFGYKSGIKP